MGSDCTKMEEETKPTSVENSSLGSGTICYTNYNYIEFFGLLFFLILAFTVTMYCIFSCKKALKKVIRKEIAATIQNV